MNVFYEYDGIIGKAETAHLDRALQRFLIVTPIANFLQGLTNDLLYSLTSRDTETSKQVFQLMLDNEKMRETSS